MIAENIKASTQARLLEGAGVADQIKDEVKREVEQLSREQNVVPCLAAVRVGEDPASAVYVRNKIRACAEVGIRSEHLALPETTTTEELLEVVDRLNSRDDIDGILTQLPFPKQVDEASVVERIDPVKDVDGFHPINVGKLGLGRPQLVP